MKRWRYGVAVGLLATLGACSHMTGNEASRTSPMAEPTVAPGMVKQVQSKLRDDGYYKQGSVDGVWGSGTEAAVRSFQKDHNLDSNGQLDVPTIQALNLAGAPAAENGTTSADTGQIHSSQNTAAPATQPMAAAQNPPANTAGTAPTH